MNQILVPVEEFLLNRDEPGVLKFSSVITMRGTSGHNGWYFPPKELNNSETVVFLTNGHSATERYGYGTIKHRDDRVRVDGKWFNTPHAVTAYEEFEQYIKDGGKLNVSAAFSSSWEEARHGERLSNYEKKIGARIVFQNFAVVHVAIVDAGNIPGAELKLNEQYDELINTEANRLRQLRDEAAREYARQLTAGR